jgi:hypothetical protein
VVLRVLFGLQCNDAVPRSYGQARAVLEEFANMSTQQEIIAKAAALGDQIGDSDYVVWQRREAQAALRDLRDALAAYEQQPRLLRRITAKLRAASASTPVL